jgi:hypothetical protein
VHTPVLRRLIGPCVMVVMQRMGTGGHLGIAQDDGGDAIHDANHEARGDQGTQE